MLVTLAERPDLAAATYAIPYPADSPKFMAGSLASLLVRGRRVVRRWPHLVVVLLEDEVPVARGVMVPFRGRGFLPARGWDEIAVWAAEDALDDVAPDTACALGDRRAAGAPGSRPFPHGAGGDALELLLPPGWGRS